MTNKTNVNKYLNDAQFKKFKNWYKDTKGLYLGDKYKDPHTEEEMKVWYLKKEPANLPNFTKQLWITDCSTEDAYNLSCDLELLLKSPIIESIHKIESLETNDKLDDARLTYTISSKVGFGVYQRDFVAVQRVLKKGGGEKGLEKGFYQVVMSTKLKENDEEIEKQIREKYKEFKEDPKTFVRGKRLFIQDVEPVEVNVKNQKTGKIEKKTYCKWKIISSTGLNGWVPNNVISIFLKKPAKTMHEEFKVRVLDAQKIKGTQQTKETKSI